MTSLQIACLTLYAAGMALGQALFKLTTKNISPATDHSIIGLFGQLMKVTLNPFFIVAIFLYLGLSVFWVWILSFTPLSRAYPFAALALVFALLISVLFFREGISRSHLVGLTLVLGGILVIARG